MNIPENLFLRGMKNHRKSSLFDFEWYMQTTYPKRFVKILPNKIKENLYERLSLGKRYGFDSSFRPYALLLQFMLSWYCRMFTLVGIAGKGAIFISWI